MGHGNNDRLFITHAEHAAGQHSSASGFKAKAQASHLSSSTPFDCCALTFQPFTHPVCARNPDGTGNVFDLVSIVPWLKKHNNTNPITGEPLQPTDLITLHYSRKPNGQYHDPISFKPFSEHSHIVAIATTGNVFLAESIKGGKDLMNDIDFKKEDVITLQNPHGLPPASVPSTSTVKAKPPPAPPKTVAKPAQPAAILKTKEAQPWNVSPYSSGLLGASLTSTSVDPQSGSSRLVWDEEELMFEAISNPPKGKGKEKDVGKRRAYVRIVTSLGGSLSVELYCEKAPKTCYNFLMLAREGKYDDCIFHRLVPGFMIQTGDPTGTGSGGESYWGTQFRDEHDLKGAAKHDSRGILAMANRGPATNGSQFYFTFKPAPHLDRKHTVFGKLVSGEEVLEALEKLPLKDGTERPAKIVKIVEIDIQQDPFDEYKTRMNKKLAHQTQSKGGSTTNPTEKKKERDDVNWFGVKIGTDNTIFGGDRSSGVGKYLSVNANNKRGRDEGTANSNAVVDDDSKKKRKTGFGDFDGW